MQFWGAEGCPAIRSGNLHGDLYAAAADLQRLRLQSADHSRCGVSMLQLLDCRFPAREDENELGFTSCAGKAANMQQYQISYIVWLTLSQIVANFITCWLFCALAAVAVAGVLLLERKVIMKNCKTCPLPAMISLADACRRTGISVTTALKLMPDDFPEAVWIGGKRLVSRERFEGWLAEKIGKR
jgi:hypothetical protein